jgi:hypothetical protein
VEILLNTGLSAVAGALLGLLVHLFSFGGDMTRVRKASVILSVPVLLMSILWFAIYCYAPLGASESLYPYWLTLYYLSWVGAGLAVILFVRARQSRAAIVCLAINGIGAALNIVAPCLLTGRVFPYIRF